MKAFEHPPRTTKLAKRQMAAMLWLLHLNGPVVDPGGGAVRKLLKRLNDAGIEVSVNGVKRMVNSLCVDGDYPYDYVERVVNGKHTKKIALLVDPREVPFPENPFKDNPRFVSANGADVDEKQSVPQKRPVPAEQPETFARQSAFDQFALPAPPVVAPPSPPAHVEPEPEPEPESEPELEVAKAPTRLETYELPPEVRTNGINPDDDLFELPDDFLADVGRNEGRRSTDLVSQAISLLSSALAAIGTEQLDLVTVGIGQQIDERLGEYMRQVERADQSEERLRHVVGQYERVVAVARELKRENIILKRRLMVKG